MSTLGPPDAVREPPEPPRTGPNATQLRQDHNGPTNADQPEPASVAGSVSEPRSAGTGAADAGEPAPASVAGSAREPISAGAIGARDDSAFPEAAETSSGSEPLSAGAAEPEPSASAGLATEPLPAGRVPGADSTARSAPVSPTTTGRAAPVATAAGPIPIARRAAAAPTPVAPIAADRTAPTDRTAPDRANATRPPTDPAPPPHRWGLGAYLLAEAVFLGVNVLLVLPFYARDGSGHPPAAVLLLGLVLPSALAAVVALLATRLRGNGPRIDLGLRFERADLLRGLAFGCGGLLLTIPAAALWSQAVGEAAANSAVSELFAGQKVTLPVAIGVFLVVWLVAPVCEEIVYRGLLWGAVRRHGADRWWAFGLTTLSFALAHFEFDRTPLLLVISVPIGLARLYTGRLGASIVAHQVNNLLPAVSLFFLMTGVLGS